MKKFRFSSICNDCGKTITQYDIALAMNLPDIIDGPVYYCKECADKKGDIKTIFDSFINPPKEGEIDGQDNGTSN
jgi:hypothetical protein